MKIIIYITALFLLFVFYTVYTNNSTYHRRAFSIEDYFKKKDIKKINLLILGDSHLSYGLKNQYLKNNHISISYPGTSVYNWILYYDYLLNMGLRPDTVVLESGSHIFNSRRLSVESLIGHEDFYLKSTYAQQSFPYLLKVKMFCLFLFPFMLESTQLNIKSSINSLFDNSNRGFLSIDFNQSDSIWKKNSRIDSMRVINLYSDFNHTIFRDYIEFTNYIRRNKTTVILVSSPVSKGIMHYNNATKINTEYLAHFKKLSFNSYDLNDSIFLDIDHVRFSKSNFFTSLFYNELYKK